MSTNIKARAVTIRRFYSNIRFFKILDFILLTMTNRIFFTENFILFD